MAWILLVHDEPWEDGEGYVHSAYGPFPTEAAATEFAEEESIWGTRPMELEEPVRT